MGILRVVKTGIFASVEIGTEEPNFLENSTSAAQFQLIDLFHAMTVYEPVRQLKTVARKFSIEGLGSSLGGFAFVWGGLTL